MIITLLMTTIHQLMTMLLMTTIQVLMMAIIQLIQAHQGVGARAKVAVAARAALVVADMNHHGNTPKLIDTIDCKCSDADMT